MKNLTITINSKSYDLSTSLVTYEDCFLMKIDGLVRLPDFDKSYNDELVDIIESQINENKMVVGEFVLDGLTVTWAIDLTDEQRSKVILNDYIGG